MWTKADVLVLQFVIEGSYAVNVGFLLHMMQDEDTYTMIHLNLDPTFVHVGLNEAWLRCSGTHPGSWQLSSL